MDQDATWYSGRPRPRPHCHTALDGDPVPPLPKGGQPPNFPSMSIVAKQSLISATAEHLYYLFNEDRHRARFGFSAMNLNRKRWVVNFSQSGHCVQKIALQLLFSQHSTLYAFLQRLLIFSHCILKDYP